MMMALFRSDALAHPIPLRIGSQLACNRLRRRHDLRRGVVPAAVEGIQDPFTRKAQVMTSAEYQRVWYAKRRKDPAFLETQALKRRLWRAAVKAQKERAA